MRILSFIPAFLLAAASSVAAAPAPVSADTSCVSPTTGGNGNVTALQPALISIIANATAQIQLLSGQLTGLKGDSCTPDAVSSIVVQINHIVLACVGQLQATAKVDLTGYDLNDFCETAYGLLTLILVVLNTLVAIVISLGVDAVNVIQTVVINLLNAVTDLLGCLKVFVGASTYGVLGPVVSLVCAIIDLLLSIVNGLDIVVGVH